MTPTRFPHSEIPGSKLICSSPRLIAACHVLHRLSAPRHPPCTLSSLTKLECICFGSTNLSSMPDSVVKDPSDSGSTRKRLSHAHLAAKRRPDRILPREEENERATLSRSERARKPDRKCEQRTECPWAAPRVGGADRNRTDDLRLARAALSQLSYSPEVGPSGGPR